ncbi:hypothetical protein R6Q59_034830 [Mikania micrantha]
MEYLYHDHMILDLFLITCAKFLHFKTSTIASLKWIAKFNFQEISWQKKSKQDQTVQKPVSDYEKRRLLTVEQNKNKLLDLGVKNIANSFTSLVESKKN